MQHVWGSLITLQTCAAGSVLIARHAVQEPAARLQFEPAALASGRARPGVIQQAGIFRVPVRTLPTRCCDTLLQRRDNVASMRQQLACCS